MNNDLLLPVWRQVSVALDVYNSENMEAYTYVCMLAMRYLIKVQLSTFLYTKTLVVIILLLLTWLLNVFPA